LVNFYTDQPLNLCSELWQLFSIYRQLWLIIQYFTSLLNYSLLTINRQASTAKQLLKRLVRVSGQWQY